MTKKLTDPKPKSWQQYHTHTSSTMVASKPNKPTLAQARYALGTATRQHYDGSELQPYTGRPGAMRAYTLPSLVAGQRMPRKAPACILTAKYT